MRTHVALLCGINLGRRNRLAMAELRRVVAATGLEEVATYAQSGNVVFRCSEAGPTALATDRAARRLPPRRDRPRRRRRRVGSRGAGSGVRSSRRGLVVGRELYLRTPDGLARSVLAGLLARPPAAASARVVATMRTWATVSRVMSLLDEDV